MVNFDIIKINFSYQFLEIKMPLVFASISPHPPIIIPEIGGENLKEVSKTVNTLKELALELEKVGPDLILIISPHGPVFPDRMSVRSSSEYFGNFASFGAPEIDFHFKGSPQDSQIITQAANTASIPTITLDLDACQKYGIETNLDHGTLVPAYYLLKNLKDIPIIPITFSYLSLEDHFKFGQIIAQIPELQTQSIAIVASGDLSHALTYDAPAGYTPKGKEFDEKLISLLKENKIEEIKNLDPDFIEEAAECGLRSILILLGILQNHHYQPKILSYEGPFGVGYLVANFKIKI